VGGLDAEVKGVLLGAAALAAPTVDALAAALDLPVDRVAVSLEKPRRPESSHRWQPGEIHSSAAGTWGLLAGLAGGSPGNASPRFGGGAWIQPSLPGPATLALGRKTVGGPQNH